MMQKCSRLPLKSPLPGEGVGVSPPLFNAGEITHWRGVLVGEDPSHQCSV